MGDDARSVWTEAQFLATLPDKWIFSAIAESSDIIVGHAIVSRRPGSLHVHRLGVSPALRGARIGARLIEWVAARARDRGATAITLKVRNGNDPALRFYERLGFMMTATGQLDPAFGEELLLGTAGVIDILRGVGTGPDGDG